MRRNYPPGLYRVDSWRGRGLLGFRTEGGNSTPWCVLDGHATRGLSDAEVTDARPMLALYLQYPDLIVGCLREAAERDLANEMPLRNIAQQIEQQIEPTTPEPGSWARVLAGHADLDGAVVWVHFSTSSLWLTATHAPARWAELVDPVVVTR